MLKKTIHKLLILIVTSLILPIQAHAYDEQQNAEAARKLLTEAVSYYKENGNKSFAVFSRQGPFVKDGLYVFVINSNGTMLASGGPSAELIGRDFLNIVDIDIKSLFQSVLSSPETETITEGSYPWRYWDTTGRKITKHVFYQRVGDNVLAVGYYKSHANSEEALGLLDIAVKAVKSAPQETFSAINSLDERFYKDDLYTFVVDLNNKRFVAHGATSRLIGRDFSVLTDQTGKPFGQDALESIINSDMIEFTYLWKHPISGKMEKKHAYARKVDDYMVAVGYYPVSAQ